jgi:hypothetical protein
MNERVGEEEKVKEEEEEWKIGRWERMRLGLEEEEEEYSIGYSIIIMYNIIVYV